MNPKPTRKIVSLPPALAEKVALWASVMDVSHAKLIEIAVNRWEQLTPFDALGITPLSAPDAPHKADD